jgi:hypothetical protein
MIEYEEENIDTTNIEISNTADWTRFNNPVDVKSTDPFDVQGEDLTKISGLSPAFKRKISRELNKRFEGVGGAKTQQNLMAQAISGYAMFDLVESPYNLEYLSSV